MKIIPGFKLRTVMGKPVIVAEGANQANFNKIITLNDSAAMLWRAFEDKDFTADDFAKCLVDYYEIDSETAKIDAQALVEILKANGLIE